MNCSRILRITTRSIKDNVLAKSPKVTRRFIGLTACRNGLKNTRKPPEPVSPEEQTELAKLDAKELLERQYPDYYQDGKFVERISYIDFCDEALERIKELGKHRDLETYKEILKVFPPGKYCPKSSWDIGLFHAPQQLCAVRILNQMDLYGVIPDKETERIVVDRFSIYSVVWQKCGKMNYWFMKFRNLDPCPLPEVVPKKTHEIAKVALVRMLEDQKSVVTVTNTSSLPDVIDKTWVVYSQSPVQKKMIEELPENSLLYIEDAGLTYVQDNYLSYYMLKIHSDDEIIKQKRIDEQDPEPDFNYNTCKMNFYGKPIKEKMKELEEVHYDGSGYVLALGITGTSSHDSVLSWLKLLQKRNPKLSKMRVLFKLERPGLDMNMANVGSGGPPPWER